MGGEKAVALFRTSKASGSPPRERGKGKARNAVTHQLRITPAWAGKSQGGNPLPVQDEDHPRVGGEKLAFPAILARELGSPPRGRGKAPGHPVLRISARITPAWAGKSPPHWWRSSITEDHPRVGGEKLQELTGLRNTRGSPPRGRGKACRPVGISALTRDHPRVGGEKSDPSDLRLSTPGSPPRGRGKGRYSPPTATATGITPAWAGKSHGA